MHECSSHIQRKGEAQGLYVVMHECVISCHNIRPTYLESLLCFLTILSHSVPRGCVDVGGRALRRKGRGRRGAWGGAPPASLPW